MIAGLLKLWFAALSLAGKAFTAVAKWARDPDRNWWAVACCVLAVGFLFAASAAQDAKREIVVVTQACDAKVAAEVQRFERADGALTACLANAAIERAKHDEVARQAIAAVAEVRAANKAQQAELSEWMRTYRAKPATCSAALTAMEAACAGLSDY